MPPPETSTNHPPSLFHRVYVRVAGRHPALRPWHFQWLAGMPLYAGLRPLLAAAEGDVLDVGCGYKPYGRWMPRARRHFGIDVFAGANVDALIVPGQPWPVADGEFDLVLCTQVLEHVADLGATVEEIVRAIKPGGQALITVPFIFHEHNSPHDYRRLSRHGARLLFEDRLEILAVSPQGGVGSTVGVIFLGWTFEALPRNPTVALLLPFWMLLCLGVNALGWLVDRFDRTGLYYGNVLVHARKPSATDDESLP